MKYLGAISNDYDLVNKKYIDTNFLSLAGGTVTGPVTFGDSIAVDEATLGDLVVTGSASITNNLQVNTINGVTVGSSPKFTDNNTTYSAGTGLSLSSTTFNHSNSVTAQTTQAVYPIKIDAQGHISAYGSAVTIPTNTDTQVTVAALTSGTAYYPILATGTGTATRQIDSTLGGLKYTSTAGTTSAVGTATLQLGNATASGTANNEQGVLRVYGTTAYYTDIKAESGLPAANRTIYLPSYTGTMYLTCTSTTSAVGGATTKPVYVDATGRIQAVTSIPYSLLTGTPTIPTVYNQTICATGYSNSSSVSMSANSFSQVALNQWYCSNESVLAVNAGSEGGITIYSTGMYKISASIYFSSSSATSLGTYVYKASNNGAYSSATELIGVLLPRGSGSSTVVPLSTKMVELNQYDILYLVARNVSGSASTLYPNNNATYLTVEAVSLVSNI